MWQTIMTLPAPLSVSGRDYQVIIEGQQRADDTWAGRISFSDGKSSRKTEQETSQPNRGALEYWATGLEQVYLEGAFERTHD